MGARTAQHMVMVVRSCFSTLSLPLSQRGCRCPRGHPPVLDSRDVVCARQNGAHFEDCKRGDVRDVWTRPSA